MKERIFVDKYGQELIVRHRKSAVFFEGFANPDNVEVDKPILSWENGSIVRGEGELHYKRSELDKVYVFSKTTFEDLYEYLLKISKESWKNFEPKEADSLGSDYDCCWDRDHQDECNLSFHMNSGLSIQGPYQRINIANVVRLYKFNKRKMESFIYDYREKLNCIKVNKGELCL